jgi:hypothetical protein
MESARASAEVPESAEEWEEVSDAGWDAASG